MFYMHENYCLVVQKRFQNFDYMFSVFVTNFPSVNKDDNAFGKLNYLN